ncbi:hypothetical protein V4R08_00135 [Nitrobacter sp. NHB1]
MIVFVIAMAAGMAEYDLLRDAFNRRSDSPLHETAIDDCDDRGHTSR